VQGRKAEFLSLQERKEKKNLCGFSCEVKVASDRTQKGEDSYAERKRGKSLREFAEREEREGKQKT